jgi:hypothetical protein
VCAAIRHYRAAICNARAIVVSERETHLVCKKQAWVRWWARWRGGVTVHKDQKTVSRRERSMDEAV